jgi:hypothetical protein
MGRRDPRRRRARVRRGWPGSSSSARSSSALATSAQHTRSCRLGSGIMQAVGWSSVLLAAEARDPGRAVVGVPDPRPRQRKSVDDFRLVRADPEAPVRCIEELVVVQRLDEGPFFRWPRGVERAQCASGPRDPIYTAGVSPRMIESACRVADGCSDTCCRARGTSRRSAAVDIEGPTTLGAPPPRSPSLPWSLASVSDLEKLARRDPAAMIAFLCGRSGPIPTFIATSHSHVQPSGSTKGSRRRDADTVAAAPPDEMVDAFALAGTPLRSTHGYTGTTRSRSESDSFPTVVQVSEGPLPERFTLVPRHWTSAAA